MTRKITWHAAAIKLGSATSWRSATSTRARDWGYAKDYVEAMWLMLQHDEPDDFVIATGETNTVRALRRGRVRRGRPGLGAATSSSTRSSCARPRSTCWSATRRRPSASSAGSRRRSFEELIRLMVRSDLELLSK